MAFNKTAIFNLEKIKVLNTPKNWDIFNLPNQIKTAATKISIDEDLNGFDLKEATKKHPDHLYIKIFAIKKDEPNDNGDAFNEEELKKAAHTFIGVPIFTNHQNDDVEKARGDCVHSWYDKKAGGIYVVARIDKVAYPKLARGIEEQYITGSSMGAAVENSICSICHNKAHTADDFCSCIKERKNRKFSGAIKCKYHESKVSTDEKCPLCGSTKENIKLLEHKNQQTYEHNYGLKFIENSFVVSPACHGCGVHSILHIPTIKKKVASLKKTVNTLIKYSKDPAFVEENIDKLDKIGGIKELNDLKESMTNLENVVQSMLKQKEQISMEYVSDLVKAMADVQGITDELVEMGYGKLSSPSIVATEEKATSEIFPETIPTQPIPEETLRGTEKMKTPQVADLGGLGTITKPKISSGKEKKIKDFLRINTSLVNKISSLKNILDKLEINRSDIVSESLTEVSSDVGDPMSRRIVISKDNDEIFITEVENGTVLKMANVSEFPEEMQELIKTSLEEAGKKLLEKGNLKEIGATMTIKNTKTAANESNQEVITEKQLQKQEESLHPRTDETYESITESKEQIGRPTDLENVTTSESPEIRKGTYETITQDQLGTVSEELVRFNNTPDIITEKQWDDMSRLVSGKLSEDYTSVITDKQIRELLSNHQFVGDINAITEKQLEGITLGVERWANTDYTVSLMKTATESIADAVAKYNKSPQELSQVAAYISDNDDKKSRASFLAVVNSLPHKIKEREILESSVAYFNKIASGGPSVSSVDALILSVAKNGKFGQKVEDVFESIGYVFGNKIALAKVQELVKIKVADNIKDKNILNKFDAFDSAVKMINKPEDGKYKIYATLEDVDVPITEKKAFLESLKKLVKAQINNDSVAAAIIKVQVGENGELIIDIEDGGKEEIGVEEIGNLIEGPVEELDVGEIEKEEEEKEVPSCIEASEKKDNKKLAGAREEIVKKAQLMGGEMGGQGGISQAPGAGATMPMAPGAPEAAPVENFEEPPVEGEGDEIGGLEEAEPLPPGSICPACGSQDVDIISGKGECNSCGAKIGYKIQLDVTDWPDITPKTESPGEEGEIGMGEGFELPGGELPGGEPAVAAYMKLEPDMMQKLSEKNIKIGSISPAIGSNDTLDLGKGNHVCLETGTKYKVSYITDTKGDQIWGQWEWKPVKSGCSSCKKAKQKFVQALSSINIDEEKFDSMDLQDKVNVIMKLKEEGTLNSIKTASKEGSVLEDYKVAFGGYGDKFPIESCIEKLARRFGENAIALSGPCEGKPLADCVCNQLKNADVYTDRIAIKLGEAWKESSGDEDCITDQVRAGRSLREAAAICNILKIAVAAPEDLLADEIDNNIPIEEPPVEEAPITDDLDIDPFEDAEATITIELPKDVVEQLDEKLDEALGESSVEETIEEMPEGEGMMEKEIPVEGEVIEEVKESPLEEINECPDVGIPENILENKEGFPEEASKVIVNDHTSSSEHDYYKEAKNMKSNIGETGKVNMDLSKVVEVLQKQAAPVQQEKAQDSTDIGTYSAGEDGSKMGHENETIPTAQKPSVPRNNATMGQEPADLNPQDGPQPDIPSINQTLGHEEEAGLSGGDVRYTGGDKAQGKVETASVEEENDFDVMHMRGFGSSKEGLNRLAKRILEAGEKKLAPKAPVSEDKDIQPIQDKGTIGNEEKFDAGEPTTTEGGKTESLIGHEKETLESAPKSPQDHPSIPANDARMGQEELIPEKQNLDKGTVIAKSDLESEAYRVAAKMLEANIIDSTQLQKKVEELKTYKPAQIKDFEKAIFAGKKGLDTVSDGMSQAVVISETSNIRNSQDDLATQLADLFSLEKQNKLADEDETIQLRKTYRK